MEAEASDMGREEKGVKEDRKTPKEMEIGVWGLTSRCLVV